MMDDFYDFEEIRKWIYCDTDAVYFEVKKKGKEKMKKAKFKEGDKVIIKDGSKIKNYHGGWIRSMNEYVGKTGTISYVSEYNDSRGYRMKEYDYTWDERGLVKADAVYTVIVSGRKVTVEGNGTTGEARCNPDDDFDLSKGISLAIERMNAIKEGDWVEVVNPGKTYTTYSEWVTNNIENKILIAQYKYYESVPKFFEGKVIKIAKHGYDDDTLAFIKGYNGCYLISVSGLKKVKAYDTE